MNNEFFNAVSQNGTERFPELDLPENVVSDTRHTIGGYKLRCIKQIVKTKRTQKLKEKWFVIENNTSMKLPEYVKSGAHRTGYNSLSGLFSCITYYKNTFY
jgi:hypothetical protein